MNEISPSGETDAWILNEGKIEHVILTPESFGDALHVSDRASEC